MLTSPLAPAPMPSTEEATALAATLPPDFLFGVSTASYQIEGGVTEDGKGRSVWDDFCETPGKIVDGSSGAVACDSYHRYGEDVALMADLGVGAYRFSLAWPRILPDGAGAINGAGLDYYDRLVDALCAAGIQPAATLFHWDLPSALQAGGGWTSRDTAYRFGEYAAVVAQRLADRVAVWFPVNEPNIVTTLGHGIGRHAPGMELGLGALQVGHHLLLGHGLAVEALRAHGARAVGCANNHQPIWPASAEPADLSAAALFDAIYNRFFVESMILGAYPDELAGMLSGPVAEDLAVIAAPLDFYGVNTYNPMRVAAPGSAAALAAAVPADGMPFVQVPVEGYPTTDFGWPVVPRAFGQLLRDLTERYPGLPPIVVTENGCSTGSAAVGDERTEDRFRVDFYAQHLAEVARARADGVDIRGYFAWSLLDNFEWAEGYTQRFGLVWMDFATLERTPKASYRWYRDLVSAVRGR